MANKEYICVHCKKKIRWAKAYNCWNHVTPVMCPDKEYVFCYPNSEHPIKYVAEPGRGKENTPPADSDKKYSKEKKTEVLQDLLRRGCMFDRFSPRCKTSRPGEVVESMSPEAREVLKSLTAEDIYDAGYFLMYFLAETDKGVESIKRFLNKEEPLIPHVGRFRQQLSLEELEKLRLERLKDQNK